MNTKKDVLESIVELFESVGWGKVEYTYEEETNEKFAGYIFKFYFYSKTDKSLLL